MTDLPTYRPTDGMIELLLESRVRGLKTISRQQTMRPGRMRRKRKSAEVEGEEQWEVLLT